MNRYQRIIELGWKVETLQQATAIVVGAGALGNEVLKNLALLGLGTIIVADMDVIEDHNLTRTVLFRAKDIGRYKAVVAAERVQEMNPDVKVLAFTKPVQEVLGLGFYKEADVVFGCLDNIQARIDVNRYCYQTNTLYIDAGLRLLDGDVKVLGNGFNICLDCTLSQKLRYQAWERFSCLKLRTKEQEEEGTRPTSPTISSIMAGFQVQIAIKYLHDMTVPFDKRISVFGNIDDVSTSRLSPNPTCPTHNLYDPIPLTKIHQLPFESNKLTLKEFINYLENDIGTSVAVRLDFDLITYFKCSDHQHRQFVLGRRGRFFVDEAICPTCQAAGRGINQSIMREHFINQLDHAMIEGIEHRTLAEIGVPLYQIFEVKSWTDNEIHYHYYEITGDK